MTRVLFITVLFMSSIAFSQEVAKKGVLEFESEVIDYGNIAKNSDGKRTFVFKNIGYSPILISKIKGSCGCTVTTKPENAILPGETAEIGVVYATNRTGGFSKTITIISNASEASKVVRIKGNVMKNNQIASVTKN